MKYELVYTKRAVGDIETPCRLAMPTEKTGFPLRTRWNDSKGAKDKRSAHDGER